MATSNPITPSSSKQWLKEHTASFLRRSSRISGQKTIAQALLEMDQEIANVSVEAETSAGNSSPDIIILKPTTSRKRKASLVRQETPKKRRRFVEVVVLDENESEGKNDVIVLEQKEEKEKKDQEVQEAIREIEEECPPTPPPRTTSLRSATEEQSLQTEATEERTPNAESPTTTTFDVPVAATPITRRRSAAEKKTPNAETSTPTTTDAPAAATPTTRRRKIPSIRRTIFNKKPVDDTTVTMRDILLSPSVITLAPRRSSCSFQETRIALYVDPSQKNLKLPKLQEPFRFVKTSDIFPKIRCAAVVYILKKPLNQKDLPEEPPTIQVTVSDRDGTWLESFPSEMEICDLRNALEAFVRELC